MRKAFSILAIAAMTVPALAVAQGNRPLPQPIASTTPDGAPAPKNDKLAGKNKMVCEKVIDTGTRLGGRRICHTAAEWAEIRAYDRREIEQRQANRYNGNQ